MARRRKSSGLWRILRWPAYGLGIVVAIPLVLVPLYLVVDPVSVPMVARYLSGRPVDRQWRDIDAVSDRLKASVILSEDGQFCRHWGVDVGALRDEVENYLAGDEARGASTITMQVARNLFLWNGQSVVRKALEVPLAVYIDLVMPKRRIMEIYLNIAEWGPDGEFGVEAGAQRAYRIPASAVNAGQAALLAVMLPNPHRRDAGKPGPGVRRLAGRLEARTVAEGPGIVSCLGLAR